MSALVPYRASSARPLIEGATASRHTAKIIMKTKFVSQRFFSGLLVILSVTSLAMLLQFGTPGISGDRLARLVRSGGTVTDAYALFNSGALSRAASGPAYLLVSLGLIALLSLLSLHLSRQPKRDA